MVPSQASAFRMLIAFLLVFVIGLLPGGVRAPCPVVQYAMDLRTCFRIREMKDAVIIHSKNTIVETSLQVEGLFANPQHVCRKKDSFSELFDCMEGTTAKCVKTEEEMNYLPNATRTKEGLEYFCQHVGEIDEACYNQSYSQVFECVDKLTSLHIQSNHTPSTRACITVDITHDCIHEHMSCDDPTRDLLLKFQDEHWKPKGCPAPARSNREKYITSGSTMAAFVSKLFCIGLSFVLILLHTD